MKTLIFWTLAAIVIIAGGYYAYQYWETGEAPQLDTSLEEMTGSVAGYSTDFGEVNRTATEQLQILGERVVEIGGHTRTILSSAIQPNQSQADNDKSLPQSAAEYGQYLYCKQVVETFEASQQGTDDR